MNARHALVCSLLVNVALCAAANHLFHLRRPQGFVVPLKRTIKTVTNEFMVSKSPAPAPSEPRVRLTEFQWALIESEDYATYIHNLRAIGCPEKTIRDIIAGEIDRLFAARRRALIGEADNFWTTKSARAADDFEHGRFLASLAAEKEALRSDLEGLGIDVRQSQFDFDAPSVEEWVAAPFGAEKQTRLRQIHRRFVRAFEAVHAEAGGMLTVEEDARVARLFGQLRREIDAVLAASERQEYWVRHAAFDLQLAGFSGTEQQYRGLALLQRDMNLARMDLAAENSPAGAMTPAQLQRDFDEKARELLGPEAYAEFVRARDPDFHQLQQFAEENQLSAQVAIRTYDLRRAAERELDRIRADDRLSADERRVALELVRRQTEQALRATLSGSTLQAYFRTAGRWVQSIYP